MLYQLYIELRHLFNRIGELAIRDALDWCKSGIALGERKVSYLI